MSLSDLGALGSFVSGVAVLAPLALLWFQLRQMTSQVRQSKKNQRASIRQVHSMRISDAFLRRVEHAELWVRAYNGDPLSDAEIYQIAQSNSAVWFAIEDSFHQYRDGLLDEATWQANLVGLRYAAAATSPSRLALYSPERSRCRLRITGGRDHVEHNTRSQCGVIAAYRASISRQTEAAAAATP